MPGEKLAEPLRRVIGDPPEHVGEPGLRVVVELGRGESTGTRKLHPGTSGGIE